jgi:hypothetical protein
LIEEALRALDRADEAREAVDHDGLSFATTTTGTVHLHPLLKVEREQRALFAKLWSATRFQWSDAEDGRLRS